MSTTGRSRLPRALLAEWSPGHASNQYRALQQAFKWLAAEGELDRNPFDRLSPPTVPDGATPVLSVSQLRALLKVCEGRDFRSRRDAALIRLFADTGAWLSEIANLAVTDVDFDAEVVQVLGKGRRPRAAPFGAKTAMALDRYLRERRKHPRTKLPALWLSNK